MDTLPPPIDPAGRTWLDVGEAQRLLLDAYPGVVLQLGGDGRVTSMNPAATARLGYGREALTGRELIGSLLSREEIEQHAAALAAEWNQPVAADASVLAARLQRGALADEHDWILRHQDGSPQPTRLAMGILRDAGGRAVGLLAVEPWPRADDAPGLRLTHHDSLTGLPTRAVLPDRAEMALQRAARQRSVVALMLVELVGFDALCETHGHTVGDDLLRATASRLHFELRKTDTAVRLDRGQFAAMLVDLHDAGEARLVAEKIQRALSARVNTGVAHFALPARIGIAWSPVHGDQLLPLLQAAEAAMNTVIDLAGGVATAPAAPVPAEE